MTLRSLAARAAILLAVSAIPAYGQISLSLAGGASVPLGTLADLADIGYNAAAGVNVGAPLLPVGLKFEGAYNSFRITNIGGDVRIISGTANAVFNIGRASDSPYVIAGLGAYNRRLNIDPIGSSRDKTVVGINGGAGLRFPLSGFTTFFEARYHIMLGDSNDDANYQFIPITVGIVF